MSLLQLLQNQYTKALENSTIGSDPIASEPIGTGAFNVYGAAGTGQAGTLSLADLTGAACTGTVGGVPAANPPPTDYVSYWPLDNSSLSPGGGSLFGSPPPTYTTGRIGGGLSNTGTLSGVQITSQVLSSSQIAAGFTITAWLQDSSPTGSTQHTAIYIGVDSNNGIFFGSQGTYGLTACIIVAGVTHKAVGGYGTLTASTWYHVALTWDGATLLAYLNGVTGAQTQFPVTPTGFSGSNSFLFAANTAGNPLTGLLDDVRVYSYALTPTQIAAVINFGGADPGTVISISAAPSGAAGIGAPGTISFGGGMDGSGTATGVNGTGQAGTPAASISAALTGVSGTGQVGSAADMPGGSMSGVAGTGTAGGLTPRVAAAPNGVSGTGQIGTVVASVAVTSSGVNGTGQVGLITIQAAPVGVSATAQVGTILPDVEPNTFNLVPLYDNISNLDSITPSPLVGTEIDASFSTGSGLIYLVEVDFLLSR